MVKSSPFSSSAVDQVYHRLQVRQKNGIYFEYDVRVDGETLFPRTNSLDDFFLFQDYIVSSTEQICFHIYKGKSNRYDRFEFYRNQKSEDNSVLSIEQKIEEALKKQRTEFELETLRSSVARYKEKTRDLKERVNQLESELRQSSTFSDIAKLLQQHNAIKNGELPISDQSLTESQPLNGHITEVQQNIHPNTTNQNEQPQPSNQVDLEPMDELTLELLSMLTKLKNNLSEETFEKLMGTTLMLGHNPEIISETRNFIALTLQSKQHENTNESQKES